MNQKKILRYYILCLTIFLAVWICLLSFFRGYAKNALLSDRENFLDQGVRSLNQSITAMMDLSGRDFQYLLENEKELLFATLESQAQREDADLFITDDSGKVLVASTGAPHGTVPDVALGNATRFARDGQSFVSNLGNFYPEERLFRVVILEKEYSENYRQRIGLIFFSLSEKNFQKDLSLITNALLLVFFLVTAAVFVLARIVFFHFLKPLKRLDEAAESFAKGDFSTRLSEEENGGVVTPLLRTFNQMAQRVEKNETIRQTFVSNVSHDLRTPLTTISGFVQNMLNGSIPEEKLPHYYSIIIGEVDRLSRLVQTLLETSRMTAGERKYTFQPMDLCELARITFLSFEKRLEEKDLDVTFFTEPDSIQVNADKDAIQQVIYNLLDNAIKFTPPKGRLCIEITEQDKKAFFAVTNSGDGIPEEEMLHLFDRFYKSDRSRGLDKKGMGLGLFIAKSVISAHGEELWVESREGSYTQFVFSLKTLSTKKRKSL